MIKAVFIDYMGTLVSETSQYAQEVIGRVFSKSGAKSLQDVAVFWFGKHDELLAQSSGPNYQSEYDISLKTFKIAMEHYGYVDDAHILCDILAQHWVNAPAFDDTSEFFAKCPLPIYLVTSNDTRYVEAGIKILGVCPTGIITSEMAKAYKPQKEIFEMALRVSGCNANEVIHIGDSLQADVIGAQNVGITPWLLDRTGKHQANDVKIIGSLREALVLLSQEEISYI